MGVEVVEYRPASTARELAVDHYSSFWRCGRNDGESDWLDNVSLAYGVHLMAKSIQSLYIRLVIYNAAAAWIVYCDAERV